jgi:hypothetical protein
MNKIKQKWKEKIKLKEIYLQKAKKQQILQFKQNKLKNKIKKKEKIKLMILLLKK